MTNGESREKETESRFGSGHGYVTGRRRGRVTNDRDELRGLRKEKRAHGRKERKGRKETKTVRKRLMVLPFF